MTSSVRRRLIALTTAAALVAGGTAPLTTAAATAPDFGSMFFFDFAKLANGAQTQGGQILNGDRTHTFTEADGLPKGMKTTVTIKEAAALARLSDYADTDADGNEVLTQSRLLAKPADNNPFFRGKPTLTQAFPARGKWGNVPINFDLEVSTTLNDEPVNVDIFASDGEVTHVDVEKQLSRVGAPGVSEALRLSTNGEDWEVVQDLSTTDQRQWRAVANPYRVQQESIVQSDRSAEAGINGKVVNYVDTSGGGQPVVVTRNASRVNVTLDDRPWAATSARQAVVAGLYLPTDRADGGYGEAVHVRGETQYALGQPQFAVTDTSVSVKVPVSGGEGKIVSAWMDANGNGEYEAGERAVGTVHGGAATLMWDVGTPRESYPIRLRVAETAIAGATDTVIGGEVEDVVANAPAPQPAPQPTPTVTVTTTATTTATTTETTTAAPAPVPPGTVGGYIWRDTNNNGVKDGDEPGFRDILVRVMPPAGVEEPVHTTSTDADGFWEVKGLTPNQDYTIEYVVPGVEPGDVPDGYKVGEDGRVHITVHISPDQPVDLNRGVAFAEEPRYQVVTERVTEKVTVTRVAPTVVTHTATAKPLEPKRSFGEVVNRCAANAVESPLLYLFPVVIGLIFGLPVMLPEINERLAQAGGNDALRAQLVEFERVLRDPQFVRVGGASFAVLYLAAAIAITYDWCANDYGEAITSLGSSNR